MESPVLQARALLARLDDPASGLADELLLFFYGLRDGYRIVRSNHPLVNGKSFAFLNPFIYRLESAPDSALRDEDSLSLVRAILEGITAGSILIEPL